MHRVVYTLRDALYVAGMLNVFHRRCSVLGLANLAQFVDVLPAIVTDEKRAYATPIRYPFLMYRQMERLALHVRVSAPTFDSEALGNIVAHTQVPYLDVTATRDEAGRTLVLGVVNRHPEPVIEARIVLHDCGEVRPCQAWLLGGPTPLVANSFDAPENVAAVDTSLPAMRDGYVVGRFPAASLSLVVLG